MDHEDNYPPYNIERTGEDRYQISLALAGFTADEVTITAEQNLLTVAGDKSQSRKYLGSNRIQVAFHPFLRNPNS